MNDDTDDIYDDEPYEEGYLSLDQINFSSFRSSLESLALFRQDSFLVPQAFSLEFMDQYITALEYDVLAKWFEQERTPMPETLLLSSLSQMWIFTLYELLRTWRERCKELIKPIDAVGLTNKLNAIKKRSDADAFGNQIWISQIETILANYAVMKKTIQDDLDRTYFLFRNIEFLRVCFAKHETPKPAMALSITPGYGRIDHECGSLKYEFRVGMATVGWLSRRDLAEMVRNISTATVPTKEERDQFDKTLRADFD